MQTIYYETSSFIRHQGNVVDLGAYRQKLAAVSGDPWTSPAREEAPEPVDSAPVLTLVPDEAPSLRRERSRRRDLRRFGMCLDLAASAAIVALTLAAVVSFLRL